MFSELMWEEKKTPPKFEKNVFIAFIWGHPLFLAGKWLTKNSPRKKKINFFFP